MATKKNLAKRKLEAMALFRNQRLDDAISAFREICQADKKDAEAWYMLSAINGMTGRYTEAESCARRAVALQPGYSGALKNLGAALLEQGKIDEAQACFERVLVERPGDSEAQTSLGNLWFRQGEYRQAEQCYRTALKLQPGNPQGYNNLGSVLLALGAVKEADSCFDQAIRLQPGYPDALINKACVCRKLGNSGSAQSIYSHVLAAAPDNLHARLGLAELLVECSDLDAADRSYSSILEQHPLSVKALLGLSAVRLRQRRHDEALACAIRAGELEPGNAEAQFCLGITYRDMGDRGRALIHMREAGRLDPGNSQTRYILAALGDGPTPKRADSQYVASLFDSYAATFDESLVGRLSYRIPEKIGEMLARAGLLGKGLDILDIGCGTGLCGPRFREHARRLVGVDLSPKMIDTARARGVYDDLMVGDVVKPMKDGASQFSHIIGADVFPYIGDLNEVFDGARTALIDHGVFVFSVESTEVYPFELHLKARYAHAERYLRELADEFGFEVVSLEDTVVRIEKGEPVKGFLVLLRQHHARMPGV